MKHLFLFLVLLILPKILLAQVQKTFIYEIKLYEQYKSAANWGENERKIQQEHIAYLDSLTQSGVLQLAGIKAPSLEAHQGFIILNTDNFEEAYTIAQNDPSIKKGMMRVSLYPLHIYFKGKRE